MATKRKTPTKKNISFESLDSIDLKKEVNLQAGTEAVKTKQEAVKKTVKTPVQPKLNSKPKPKPAVVKENVKENVKEKPEELIRITFDLPKSEHKRLKIKAMNEDLKLYQFVLKTIRKAIKS